MGKVTIREKQPVIIRWVHWFNIPFLFIMVWSGIRIYWAEQSFGKIPDVIVENFNLSYQLADAMGWHFFVMWPFTINGLIYVIFLLKQRHWNRSYGISQKIAYSLALFLNAGVVVSGITLYKPIQLSWLTTMFGGYENIRLVHFLMMIGLLLFTALHLIQVARHGWNNFRSMIAGYEIEK